MMCRFIIATIGFLFASCVFAKEKPIDDKPKQIQVNPDIVELSVFKADIQRQILRSWNIPAGSSGQVAKAVLTLDEQGGISNLVVSSKDFETKQSIERAIQEIIPIKLPPNLKLTDDNNIFKFTFTAR
ncbi:TonB C-terminal domain-containing protein [Acinetobacter colistiniresistens]|uniref:TonB C-terminal domain-containing protein n=1 Tax=Acinetobacter colistiniresistens TaxID=280145 RepID=UPI00211CBC5D|nr:TonB C-terminal domain-containing protein [Acinetobacter colistiniresistens]UUM26346.1 TonB C-terminal domain-containing protein [Acinetobacter colistiniresistens]